MTIEEKLEKLRAYFLRFEDRMPESSKEVIHGYLDDIDVENFDDVYWTLSDSDKSILENEPKDDFEEMSLDLTYNKLLHRYWDSVEGRTRYDAENNQLIITHDSSALELGISYNIFLRIRALGLYSCGQLYNALEIVNLWTNEEMESLKVSLQWLKEDNTVRLEGLHEI